MTENRKLSYLPRRRHPEYSDREAHWAFLEACYEGGRAWFDDNIFKYHKEGDSEYAARVERAYRFNHSREVVDLVNKYLFRAKVNRNVDEAPESIKNFWKHATPEGYDMDYLMAQLSKRSSISGRIYCVVDNNITNAPESKADEKLLDGGTYAYWVGPQDVLDLSFDDNGQLNWILIREYFRDDEDPFAEFEHTAELDTDEQFRLWTRDKWYLFRYVKGPEGKIEQDETGNTVVEEVQAQDHNLGRVPVVPVDHMDDDSLYSAPSLINDIAYLDRAVANYLSDLDAIIQDQTFSQLAMPAQALMPGEEEALKDKLMELGTKRIFVYNGEGGAEPKYLSPDPRQAELIITAIRTIINEIYHTVGMAGERTKMDNSQGIDNSSGVAKAYDFERVNALLVNKSKTLEKVEKEILELVALWNGEETTGETDDGRPLARWADNFDVRGLSSELEIASELALLDAPIEMRREQIKSLGHKLFPAISVDGWKKMEDEVDKDWPNAPPEDFGLPPHPNGAPEVSDAPTDEDERQSNPEDKSE